MTGRNSPQGRNTHTHPNSTSKHLQTVNVSGTQSGLQNLLPGLLLRDPVWGFQQIPNRLQHVHLDRPQPSLAPSPAPHLLQAPPAHLQVPSRSLGSPQNRHLIPDSPVHIPPSTHLRTFGGVVFRAMTPDSLLWTYSRDT